MVNHRLPKIDLNSSQNHLRLKRGLHKDAMSWLEMWGIDENVTLENIDDFKEKLWHDTNLEDMRKLRYYKESSTLILKIKLISLFLLV